MYCYKYPRAALTADIIVAKQSIINTKILLIKRKNNPYKDMWAIPGGFMDMNETIEETAHRELAEETNIKIDKLHQMHVFSKTDRDPRHRTVTVCFYGFVDEKTQAKSGDDAKEAEWFDVNNLPELAFDHFEILEYFKNNIL